jgi:hypothetical protein
MSSVPFRLLAFGASLIVSLLLATWAIELQAVQAPFGTPRVSTQAVTEFFRGAAARKRQEIVDVWKEAVRVFPQGWGIENYPASMAPFLPSQLPRPLILVRAQLQAEGMNPDDVEAVTLFKGDDGRIQRDVVLVVSKSDKRVVRVTQGFYGR